MRQKCDDGGLKREVPACSPPGAVGADPELRAVNDVEQRPRAASPALQPHAAPAAVWSPSLPKGVI